ncbi:methyltransferase domain-containing protein [Thermoactinomyces daqus]|uniref:Methyltransferase domain-containing protein n=1 Tax=Thermoactinomyces daqus TaxID=1329516 RepID=A0A7W1XAW5_9BACL|nr:methyltransferase domain-containing protein [Thermoactinomyces daqus]MBA4543332.1 methyltransferase domain-containing protein [Thermoactinomyces daqus]
MKINKKQFIRQMNRTISYDEFLVVYKRMAHRLLFSLKDRVFDPGRILDLGCGTGYFTELLLEYFPRAELVALDLSPRRIEMARERVASARVQFVAADVEEDDLSGLGMFDLVITNLMGHWLQAPERVLAKVREMLNGEGWYGMTVFGPETCQELQATFRQVELEWELPPQRHFLPFRTVEEWVQLLDGAGLSDVTPEECWQRIEYEDCRTLLERIKAAGESYSESKQNFILQRNVLTEVMRRYNRAYRSKSGIYATFHILTLWGKKRDQRKCSFTYK